MTANREHLTDAPFHLGYRPCLDGLRGIAILLVLGEHAFYFPPGCMGFVGVDLFFVLSGFLITCLLLEEWEKTGRISLGAFYIRRALRLFPALFLLVGVCTAYYAFNDTKMRFRFDLGEVKAALFYYMNWAQAYWRMPTHYLAHTWSLSLEEQFYLVWPPLFWLLLRFIKRNSLLNTVLLGVFCFAGWRRLFIAMDGGVGDPDYARLRNGLDTRADALLVGCAVALVVSWKLPSTWKWSSKFLRLMFASSCVGLVIITAVCGMESHWMACYGWFLVSLFSGGIILGLMIGGGGRLQKLFEARWLVYTGKISYSLYLWHFPIFLYLYSDRHLPRYKILILGFTLSLTATLASFYLVEQPFLKLKKRFQKVGKNNYQSSTPEFDDRTVTN